jgi:hypothetical protein
MLFFIDHSDICWQASQNNLFIQSKDSYPEILKISVMNSESLFAYFAWFLAGVLLNNNSHTVSSHQLTENETSLLSRGLNFCPVPGPINKTKLSEELDNFARSLRIKEHFGSKEVEEGDEVSSDSDSEKSEWVPNLVRTSLWNHL